jgi:hypothetical protein
MGDKSRMENGIIGSVSQSLEERGFIHSQWSGTRRAPELTTGWQAALRHYCGHA